MKKIAYQEMFVNELTHAWYVATRDLAINTLKKRIKMEAKILDAGCGTGGTIKFLEKAGFKNVKGIDNNKIALNFCRQRGLKNVFKGSVNKIPFKDKTFDAVICLDVLYHRGVDVPMALRQFNRVLKKSGFLYIQEPAYQWLFSKHDKTIETQRRFGKKDLESQIKKSQFRILQCSYYNMFLLPFIFLKRLRDRFPRSKDRGSLILAQNSLHPRGKSRGFFAQNKFTSASQSDVYKLPPLFNNIMLKVMSLEAKILKRLNLPFGLSIITICRK